MATDGTSRGSAGEQVLVVDDPHVLAAFRRVLHRRFALSTATSGESGLALMRAAEARESPFAVIVSDLRMPGMDGVAFLGEAQKVTPSAVRMVLTGESDLVSAIGAVNAAHLFRFLRKPCPGDELASAIQEALRRHQLMRLERELLDQTLNGTVEVLTQLLAVISPELFSRASRVTQLTEGVAGRLGGEHDWRLRLASMLSGIGCIALPATVVHRALRGDFRTSTEEEMFRTHPRIAGKLLERIPRLETVARWVEDQTVTSERILPEYSDESEAIFHVVTTFTFWIGRGRTPHDALCRIAEPGSVSLRVIDALSDTFDQTDPVDVVREVPALQVSDGMIVDQEVVTIGGLVLIQKGERVTRALAVRLANHARTVGVREPVRVRLTAQDGPGT